MNPYQKLIERKRKWTPVQTEAGKLMPGSEEAIFRALALRQLELPVGDFIKDSLKSEVPEAARSILQMNITDEENHDLALGYVARSFGVDGTSAAEKEARALTKAWEDHSDHTICKAMVLERSIFFVLLPFFRFCGDAGLRTSSADISRDEQIHVATNSLVCAELGLSPSPSLDRLRKATINWVMQPLGDSDSKYLNKKFWLDSSDSLMYQGKAEGLSETQRARMPAFFEHSNVNLPQYA
jgi:hypothetical protein